MTVISSLPSSARTVDLVAEAGELVDRRLRVVEVEVEAVPAVAALDAAAARRRRHAAPDDRRAAGAVGLGPALDPAEGGELAPQLGLLVAPQRAEGVDPLVGAAAAGLEGHADRLELARHVPHADADLEASLREHVDRRQLLGQDDGVAQRQDHDAGAERDA